MLGQHSHSNNHVCMFEDQQPRLHGCEEWHGGYEGYEGYPVPHGARLPGSTTGAPRCTCALDINQPALAVVLTCCRLACACHFSLIPWLPSLPSSLTQCDECG